LYCISVAYLWEVRAFGVGGGVGKSKGPLYKICMRVGVFILNHLVAKSTDEIPYVGLDLLHLHDGMLSDEFNVPKYLFLPYREFHMQPRGF
jgi:hypothetical protein